MILILNSFGKLVKNKLFVLCIIFLFSASCTTATPSPTATPDPTSTSSPSATPTESISQAQLDAEVDWASGPHAAGYDLGKGPNTYCSKCHSPLNWDPKATIDAPPNCVSCKFATDAAPRMAVGNPLIAEADWKGINCDSCHQVKEDRVNPAIGWFNPQTNYYETVATSQALCEKCHTDTATLRYKVDLGTGDHSTFDCTECHQPHSVAASCQAEGCHADVNFVGITNPKYLGHTSLHESVDCVACHDASGLEVGILEGGEIWTTFRTVEVLGRAQTSPYPSHNLTSEVNCERCHYPDNPWGIVGSLDD